MKLPKNLTPEMILEAAQSDESIGFCLWCGHRTTGVEPDARKYLCDNCNMEEVYGAEEILLEIY